MDYQYVTLEAGSDGKRYVVKTDVYQGNKCIIGDVVDAKFTVMETESDNRVECSDAVIELKEEEDNK